MGVVSLRPTCIEQAAGVICRIERLHLDLRSCGVGPLFPLPLRRGRSVGSASGFLQIQ